LKGIPARFKERTMSVSKVTGVGQIAPPVSATQSSDEGNPQKNSSGADREPSNPTELPTPRFPWLSRVTRELEAASKQPSPYGSVPLLGENLDKKV
jgi:hypothetical protein